MARMGDNYNYLVNRLPLNQEHEEWLQTKVDDTGSVSGVSTIGNGSQISDSTTSERGLSPTGPDAGTRPASSSTSTALVGHQFLDPVLQISFLGIVKSD